MNILTHRLLLQSPHEVSAKDICAYYLTNREFLTEFSPARDADFYTESYHSQMRSSQIDDWEAGRSYRFYIRLQEAGSPVIGSIALSSIVRGAFQSCFLGYQLDAAHINRGYMTEAVKQLVTFAFQDLNLHRVEANIIPRNYASRAVAEKCGFVMEGLSKQYLKINGVWEDHMHYVILNPDME